MLSLHWPLGLICQINSVIHIESIRVGLTFLLSLHQLFTSGADAVPPTTLKTSWWTITTLLQIVLPPNAFALADTQRRLHHGQGCVQRHLRMGHHVPIRRNRNIPQGLPEMTSTGVTAEAVLTATDRATGPLLSRALTLRVTMMGRVAVVAAPLLVMHPTNVPDHARKKRH